MAGREDTLAGSGIMHELGKTQTLLGEGRDKHGGRDTLG